MPANHYALARRMQLKNQITQAYREGDDQKAQRLMAELNKIQDKLNK